MIQPLHKPIHKYERVITQMSLQRITIHMYVTDRWYRPIYVIVNTNYNILYASKC